MNEIKFEHGSTIACSQSSDDPYRGDDAFVKARGFVKTDFLINSTDLTAIDSQSEFFEYINSLVGRHYDFPFFIVNEDLYREIHLSHFGCVADGNSMMFTNHEGEIFYVGMHQYNTWPGLNCGDSECSDCTDCSCGTVDRDKYPHDCICGSACYISPTPGFSECLGCDEPREKK